MSQSFEFQLSNLPEDGLRLFHGLANWVEQAKKAKPQLICWKKGQKQLKSLRCIKPKQNEKLEVPATMSPNTLYVPISMDGKNALKQLRHAFCHKSLTYDEITQDYRIEYTDSKHIAGRFTLESIYEFIQIYLQTSANKKSI